MNFINYLSRFLEINENTQNNIIAFLLQFCLFLFFVILSLIVGRYTPKLVKAIVVNLATDILSNFYEKIIEPIEKLFKITGTLILVSASLELLNKYRGLYSFLDFTIDISLILTIAWLIARLFKQIVRIYGIELIQKLGREVDELLLVAETIVNIGIGFFTALALAQRLQFNLVGLLASVGLGGLAVAFAAQKTLEQLLGTLVLYLDRPYIQGEYVRVSLSENVLARVESIGLRSTKLRIAAKGTLLIVPNSIMASKDIENVSRGKKIMVLLYLDFKQLLDDADKALVEQIVKESTNALFGIDPDSTKIALYSQENKPGTRARVTFFILGSNENSVDLRKRLLELANENISQKLADYNIDFVVQEPTIYVDSPITL